MPPSDMGASGDPVDFDWTTAERLGWTSDPAHPASVHNVTPCLKVVNDLLFHLATV